MKFNIKYKSIVVCSIILGVLISIQVRTIDIENNGLTTSKRGEQLTLELRGLKKQENDLREEIDTLKEEINKYKLENGDSFVEEEIKKYEDIAGYTNVSGPGIEIYFEKTGQNSDIIYNYDLLLSIINKLNSAQASAISINDQRIVANTYMNLKEDSLYINDTKISEPIIIKAIGPSETLYSSLNIRYGIVWEIEKYYDYKVKIIEKEVIKINAYDKSININDYSTDEDE